MDRIEEITKRLEAATPGPWGFNSYSAIFTGHPDYEDTDWDDEYLPRYADDPTKYWTAMSERVNGYRRTNYVAGVPALVGDTSEYNHKADAEFIAHAPDDLDYLLKRLKALQNEQRGPQREHGRGKE